MTKPIIALIWLCAIGGCATLEFLMRTARAGETNKSAGSHQGAGEAVHE